MKSWLQDNDIEMHSIHKKGNSAAVERFIRTLKNKIYKYMTPISKNMYIDKLDEIVDKYNNTYHRAIKMNPVDVKPSLYKENNKENRKFKIGDNVRTSKYKNIFAKGYIQNWSGGICDYKKLKILFRGHMVLVTLKAKKLLKHFTQKNYKKAKQNEFRVEKVIKRKGAKLYVKWKV